MATQTNQRKRNKKKLRKQKIKKSMLAKKVSSQPTLEDKVDYALECVEAGDFKESSRVLNKLKRKHANHSYVNYAFGVLSISGDDDEEAIRYFSRATEISPDFAEAHFNLGAAYKNQFKIPEMVDAFSKAIQLGPADSDFVQRAKKILDEFEKTIAANDGMNLDAYIRAYRIFERGVEHMELGSWETAIADFSASIKMVPKHVQSYGNIGICYASIGKKKEALEAFDKALELDPHYELALLNRKITEDLEEGECLNKKVRSIEYYRDYALKDRSYIEEVSRSHDLLPGR
jgi:tetratricopeptide (TPR) repeat protein